MSIFARIFGHDPRVYDNRLDETPPAGDDRTAADSPETKPAPPAPPAAPSAAPVAKPAAAK